MKNLFKKTIAAVSAAAITALSVPFIPQVIAADTSFPYTIQGEDMEGADLWTSIYENQIPGYNGEGFAYLTNGALSFKVTVPKDAMYQIVVRGAQILSEGGRMQTIAINGIEYSKTVPYYDKWTDIDFGVVRLNAGENEISFINKYGYMAIDEVTVKEAVFPDLSNATSETCDPDATPEAKALLKYLNSVYGSYIISGQQEIYGGGHSVSTSIRYDAGKDACVDENGVEYEIDRDSKDTDEQGNTFYWHCTGPDGQVYTYNSQNRNYGYNDYDYECKYLKELTGHYPAIRGFDFNTHNPGFAWEDGVTDRMISWAKDKNGICTASWHVTVPRSMADFEVDKDGNITKISDDWQQFTYDTKTDFVTANAMVEGTKEYYFFKECMRLLAAELTKLQDANVPVIFRPLHEAEGNPSNTDDPVDGSGAWFWWSKEGTKVYNELWKYLYTTLTEEYGLHNLIWEQNLYAWSDASAEWYTGDEWVDIVGFDKYNTEYNRHDGKTSGPNEDAESGIFWSLVDYVGNGKMVAMPENSSIPSMDNMLTENAMWLYFCTWYDGEAGAPQFISGDAYQNADTVKAIFQSDYCITLDKLPEDLYTSGGTSQPATKAPTEAPTKTPTNQPVEAPDYGDANCDGQVTIADSTAILQYLGNKDKYELSAQGLINADCYDPGSGVTPADALSIQKLDAKQIDKLPEEAE